jgi:hypothetical protein
METAWGFSFGMDIKRCEIVSLKSKELIQDYIIKLTKLMGIERIDDCRIVTLADGSHVANQVLEHGFIAAQFISDLSAAHLTLFYTQGFSTHVVQDFTREYFGSTDIVTHYQIKN